MNGDPQQTHLDERRRRLSALGHPRLTQAEAQAALRTTLRQAEADVAALASRADSDAAAGCL